MNKPQKHKHSPEAKRPEQETPGTIDPQEQGPGHELDGGESLLSGRSREESPRKAEEAELPPEKRC